MSNDHALPTELDLTRWPRRGAFEFYRGFDKPYFSVCTRIDVTALRPALVKAGATRTAAAQARAFTVTLACHFVALTLANRLEPFRYRLQQGRVKVLPVVHGSTTVLRADESFGFAYLRHHESFTDFAREGAAALAAARAGDGEAGDAEAGEEGGFAPRIDDQALLHFTTLPWLHFTSFSHARHEGREDAIPKIAFGRIDREGEGAHARHWMPLSVEVHHALMDGLHVGRFVQGFEAALREPLPWLQGGPLPAPAD